MSNQKYFVPKYISDNHRVRQIFQHELTKKHVGKKSIKLSEISPTLRAKAGQMRPSTENQLLMR